MQYYCNTYMNPECWTRDGHDKSHTLKKLNTLDQQFEFETVIYNEIHRLIRYNAILWFRHLRHFSNMAGTPKLTNCENHSYVSTQTLSFPGSGISPVEVQRIVN